MGNADIDMMPEQLSLRNQCRVKVALGL